MTENDTSKKVTFTAEESYGSGAWMDITDQHKVWLKRDLSEKRERLELFKSGQLAFHANYGSGCQVDTTPEAIAALEAEIALLSDLSS